MTYKITDEQLNIAEEKAISRAMESIYKATEKVAPEKQKQLFDTLRENVLLGIRLMVEEVYNQAE